MERHTLGELHCTVARPPGAAQRVVVLMHGFGAPGDDLVGLADALRVDDGTAWVFPRAPLTFAELYGAPPYIDARAWWPLDLERIERLRREGGVRDLSRERPAGLDRARGLVVGALDAIDRLFPNAPLTLGGFSQGAMLATDVALHEARALAGLVILSGTLVSEPEWAPRFPRLAETPIFQSHGTADEILPFSLAERLRDGLAAAGAAVTFVPFSGGHGIGDEVLDGLSTFLRGG